MIFMFDFVFCCCGGFTFFVQNTLFVTKICNSFCNDNLFSILNILRISLWPIIKVSRYNPNIFNVPCKLRIKKKYASQSFVFVLQICLFTAFFVVDFLTVFYKVPNCYV